MIPSYGSLNLFHMGRKEAPCRNAPRHECNRSLKYIDDHLILCIVCQRYPSPRRLPHANTEAMPTHKLVKPLTYPRNTQLNHTVSTASAPRAVYLCHTLGYHMNGNCLSLYTTLIILSAVAEGIDRIQRQGLVQLFSRGDNANDTLWLYGKFRLYHGGGETNTNRSALRMVQFLGTLRMVQDTTESFRSAAPSNRHHTRTQGKGSLNA